jgi:hypothetical protein
LERYRNPNQVHRRGVSVQPIDYSDDVDAFRTDQTALGQRVCPPG